MTCPFCHKKSVQFHASSEVVYQTDFGPIYKCDCGARVGADRRTLKPKGTLADGGLRCLRRQCHEAPDAIWKGKEITRNEAYALVAKAMNKPLALTHIAMFNDADCRRLLNILQGKS